MIFTRTGILSCENFSPVSHKSPPPLQVAPESEKPHKQERPFFLGQNESAWKEEECDKSLEKIALFCLEAKIAKKTSLLFIILPKEKRTFLFMGLFRTLGLLAGGGRFMTHRGKNFTT